MSTGCALDENRVNTSEKQLACFAWVYPTDGTHHHNVAADLARPWSHTSITE